MTPHRHLDWNGCFNVRDLGGLPAADGRLTRWGAVVRADAVDRLTESGWAALQAHGIRTVIDLRNDSELRSDPDLLAAYNAFKREHEGTSYAVYTEAKERFWEPVLARLRAQGAHS